MSPDQLGERALALAGAITEKLERIEVLFETLLLDAEADGRPPDLKEIANLLTCLKRSLEIARIAANLQPSNGEAHDSSLDIESVRRMLFEED